MRILIVNKFHWYKGGSETYYFELGKMLKKYGHEVAYFSTKDEKNIKTGDKEYFVRPFDGNSKNVLRSFDIIYSKGNKKEMLKALDDFKPDIVHINLFQRHLTYSIIEAIKEKNIPIVFTAHDFQAICPASLLLCNGKICTKCINNSKFNCLKNKCVKNSTLKSLLSSIEGSIYDKKEIYNMIDTIISPSVFVKKMLKKDGIETDIKVIHNFVDIKNVKCKNENYALYFGRLSLEKGILNLIKAFSNQSEGNLFIAGDGPERENIEKYIAENKLEKRIKMLGFLDKKGIEKYISNCSFVVVPSICYENCPYSILETLAIGKPIIGSNIGGIPELIENGKNGYLYESNNIDELSKIINKLFKNKTNQNKFGEYSKKLAQEKYNMENYYNQLISIYEKLVNKKNK